MKFSYNWLRELTGSPDVDPAALGQLIGMKTAECEGVVPYAPWLEQVVAARVLSVAPIEGSHNRKALVDAERYGQRTVVCGAPNCRAGMTTAYVPVGTKLAALEIRKIAIDGVESDGMLASGLELGVNRDHGGIVDLATESFALVPDHILEIDNKSLTHRPDLWGHFGLAREVAALTKSKLVDPVDSGRIPRGGAPVKIAIPDHALCPRYSALAFENVTVRPSPLWLQYRLHAIGLNPINNIVDVTNFVMAELGQPMHAFDAGKLRGDTIWARPANAGETILALNGEWYELSASNLVIADAGGPIAIGGLIGGSDSAISERTTRMILESANFHAGGIRRTSTMLKLRTDASMRFEKAQDPLNTTRGLARAVVLLEEVSPGIRLTGGLAEAWLPKPEPAPIRLPVEWLQRKLGRAIEKREVIGILESIEFQVREAEPGVLSVKPPSWRATKDISIKDDLVEEVGRMIGYASIAPRPPLITAQAPPANPERAFRRRARDLMIDQGFTEVHNYSFLSDDVAARFGHGPEDLARVSNPIASDLNLLRMSLVPGIWKNVLENCKHFQSFRLFEIGHEVHKQPAGLPREASHLTAAMFAKWGDGRDALFELKRVALCLAADIQVEPAPARVFEHPARAAKLLLGGAEIGRLFEFHPSMVEAGRATVLDLDLGELQRLARLPVRYAAIRRFPSSAFDLSVLTDLRQLAGRIEERLRSLAGPDLLGIEFLREYSGAPLPGNVKSLSYRLTVGGPERTFSSEEVGAIRTRIIDGMRGHGYELRV